MTHQTDPSFNFVSCKKNNLQIIAQSKNFLALIDLIRETFDLDHIAWWQLEGSDMTCFSTFPQKWLSTYFQHNYSQEDVVLLKTKNTLSPFQWNRYSMKDYTSLQKDIIIHAAEHGLKSGITFPTNLHKRIAITFVSESDKTSFYRRGIDFVALSYIVSNLIETLNQGQQSDLSFEITREVLSFISEQRKNMLYDIETSIRILNVGLLDTKYSVPSAYWLEFQGYLSETINKLQSLL